MKKARRLLEQPAARGNAIEARCLRVTCGDNTEGIGGHPLACFDGVNVCEYAQYQIAVGRPRRKRVSVDQVIAFVERQIASLLLERPEARVIEFPSRRVLWQ